MLRWLTKNWANTTEPTHADLRPLRIAGSLDSVTGHIREIVGLLKNWTVESGNGNEFHLTRKTGTFQFIDDIKLALGAEGDAVLIHAASRSRVGIGDFGQNRRNILELFQALASGPA